MTANPNGTPTFVHLDDVTPVPLASVTKEGDQGVTRILFEKSLNGSPDLFVAVFTMEPHQVHPRHSHPNVGEMYFVVEGLCTISLGDEERQCAAGTAVYIPAGVNHGVVTADEGCSVMVAFPQGDWDKVEKVWA
jgi:quercetin dioxygenase-like cupin family protein